MKHPINDPPPPDIDVKIYGNSFDGIWTVKARRVDYKNPTNKNKTWRFITECDERINPRDIDGWIICDFTHRIDINIILFIKNLKFKSIFNLGVRIFWRLCVWIINGFIL